MQEELNPENLNLQPDVLKVCEYAFITAYSEHLKDRHDFVRIVGDAEVIFLHKLEEPYDIILKRPHITADVNDIAFWLARINTEQKNFQIYPYLVALNGDTERFYIREKEDDIPQPLDLEPSREILKYIDGATILPV